MNISEFGLTQAEALCALYRHAACFGMGLMDYTPGDLPLEKAKKYLEQMQCFDYIGGRVIRCGFKDNYIETWLYDSDNGRGAAEWALMEYATDPKAERERK